MNQPSTQTMRAIALNRFGGPETLIMQSVPIPEAGPSEVLIRVEVAGVGVWDAFEREGGYAEMLRLEPKFPHIIGSEGVGTVVDVGERVATFKPGDRVYAVGFLNPKGGFYAEYAVVDAEYVSFIPGALTDVQAAVAGGVGIWDHR